MPGSSQFLLQFDHLVLQCEAVRLAERQGTLQFVHLVRAAIGRRSHQARHSNTVDRVLCSPTGWRCQLGRHQLRIKLAIIATDIKRVPYVRTGDQAGLGAWRPGLELGQVCVSLKRFVSQPQTICASASNDLYIRSHRGSDSMNKLALCERMYVRRQLHFLMISHYTYCTLLAE